VSGVYLGLWCGILLWSAKQDGVEEFKLALAVLHPIFGFFTRKRQRVVYRNQSGTKADDPAMPAIPP
jgi:hypothetical protein